MKIVTASLKSKYVTEIHMRQHDLTADEPEESGGDDAGPNPYDLLLAALAACTAMTVRWYADRKALDIDACEVTLSYDRIHIRDCQSCEQDNSDRRIEHIRRTVEISGDLTEEQMLKLQSIPGKCPVSRTLKSGVVIEDEVKYI
jgi:putative redox protein